MKKKFILNKIFPKVEKITILFIFIPLTFLFFLELVFSLQWRLFHDTSLMHYIAFLVDKYHYVLYKDVIETSMPGTFLIHMTVGKLFGYGDLGFRIADISWLLALLGVTWKIMENFGKRVAWASIILFGLAYLYPGQHISFQRDYLGILPIMFSLLLVTAVKKIPFQIKAFFIGVLFGFALSIKPQLVLGFPVIIFFLFDTYRNHQKYSSKKVFLLIILFAFVGLLLPLAGVFFWLNHQGSLPYFWEMVTKYLPLHVDMTGDSVIVHGFAKVKYLITSYLKFGGHTVWFIPVSLGIYISLFTIKLKLFQRKLLIILMTLAFLYSIYTILSGQFWAYHWLPFEYFIILLASICIIPQNGIKYKLSQRLFPIGILLCTIFLAIRPTPNLLRQLKGQGPVPERAGRIDDIAEFLNENLKEGDTVQPLDWVGGSVHAMLIAKAHLCTQYVNDYQFYHHISNPYIQKLRSDFIIDLSKKQPRFIIEVTTGRGWPSGPDTTTEFSELQQFIKNNYKEVREGEGYTIWETKVSVL